MYSIKALYIPAQQYIFFFRYRILSSNTKVCIRVRKYVFEFKNICSRIRLVFGTHHGAMGLEKIVSTELERIFLKYEAKHIFKL